MSKQPLIIEWLKTKNFIQKAVEKQPGPPPREGLKWKPQTHRWIRPEEQGTQTSFLSEISTSGTGGDDTLTIGSVSITKVQREALQNFVTGIARKHEDTVMGEFFDEQDEDFDEDEDEDGDNGYEGGGELSHDELWARVNDHILESISDGDYDNQIGLLKVGIPEDDDSQEAIHEIIMNNVAIGVTKHMGPPEWLDAEGNPKEKK